MGTKKKILFVKIVNRNLGDSVIAGCSEYLLKKALGVFGRAGCTIIPYDILSKDLSIIPYVDAIIFDGGGLIKFYRESFYLRIIDILEVADSLDIPVFFNAVGVEGYDENDERCMALKQAIRRPCVRGFSIRDDADTLRDHYITDPTVRIKEVFDPAVWSSDVYKNAASPKRKGVIGLCIARAKLFEDYGIEGIDRDFLLEFWKKVALLLEEKGYEWELLTNGLASDETFADEVLSYIGHGKKITGPTEVEHLMSMITSYEGIIACRMHTNIVAFSFGVPSVGFVWNDKLRLWGERIGYPERFISPGEMTPGTAVDRLITAMDQGVRDIGYFKKRSIIRELKRFLKENLYHRKQSPESVPVKHSTITGRMFAIGLGSRNGLLDNMNSLCCFEDSVAAGFKHFEVDIRLTSDDRLVCVDTWSDKTYQSLGKLKPEGDNTGMTYNDFIRSKYYGRYDTMDFDTFVAMYAPAVKEGILYLDIGKPAPDKLGIILESVRDSLRVTDIKEDRVIIRTQRKKDAQIAMDFDAGFNVAFQIPADKWLEENGETFEGRVSYATKRDIRYIILNHSQYSDERAAYLKKKKTRVIIQKANKVEEMMADIQRGAYLIGSNRTSPALYGLLDPGGHNE